MPSQGLSIRIHGSGLEVGRSALAVSAGGSRVLLDCGIRHTPWGDAHPEGLGSEAARGLDAVLVTHAHLDHVGHLPDLVAAGFKCPVYMTEATARFARLVLEDSAQVRLKRGERSPPPGPALDLIEEVRPGEELWIGGVRAAAHPAGHILGAVSYSIEGGGRRLFYSGDVCTRELRTLGAAEPPEGPFDCVLMESTYGGAGDSLPEAAERDRALSKLVRACLDRGGTALVPVFAVGRAQEALASLSRALARRRGTRVVACGRLLVAAAGAFNDLAERPVPLPPLSDGVRVGHAGDLSAAKVLALPCPKVVVATSGMLAGGDSPKLLRLLAPDERNLVLFVGFQSEGTLGRQVLDGARELRLHGERITVRAQVAQVSFSAHTDHARTLDLLEQLAPGRVVCHHGEAAKCLSLAEAAERRLGVVASAPANGTVLRI
jgi:metallo-beta-lactamase family protein